MTEPVKQAKQTGTRTGSLPWLLVIPVALGFSGCRSLQRASDQAASTVEAGTASTAGQASLFTVPPDQLAHLQTVPVRKGAWSIDIHTTGTVDWDANHTTQAITQVSGPISRILVDTGAEVKAGDPLLYVSSPDVAAAIAAYRKARNREQLTQRVINREKELLDRGAIAIKDYESAVADNNDVMTDVQNSLQSLKIFGITQPQIDQADQQGKTISAELALRAPISGQVVQRLVSPGMVIQAGMTVCFALSDVSTVWVQGHIFDHDLPSVRTGDPVEVRNASFSRTFHGTVTYVGASVDPATRTTPVRIVTQNQQGMLKKDMFVDAVIHTRTENNLLLVPVAAVLRDDKNEPMVYVQAQPGQFARRSITTGTLQNGMISVTSGLREGELVVSDGSLFLQFAGSIQ
jgi:membrane fusion protein, heavy metal efflux system